LFTSLPSTFTLGDSWSRDLIDGFHQLNRGVLRRGARRGLCRRDGTRPGEVQGIAVAAAGPHPVTPGLVTGVAIWLVLTSRHDLGPREELKCEPTGADRSR